MAAPSGTSWGSSVGSGTKQGRIGIYVSLSSTNTQTTATVQIWFWSKYSVHDSSNTLYYDNEKSSASTSRGSVSIYTTVSSGSGWSQTNQQLLKTYTHTYNRGTSSSTKTCAAKLTGVEYAPGTMTVSKSYTIPALASYKITFNANGGSGAPGQQTKYYGKTLKLSSTKPTRTGYTFQGWGTSASGSVVYAPGGNYTANASDTLYAIWKANTYTVSYNANGGSGAPSSQSKTYGVTLTLSSSIPTRTNYNFLGWGTSANSTTISYSPGSSYTSNSSITLYAIWSVSYIPPRITNLTIDRCNSSGTLDDTGTYAKVVFNWVCDKSVQDIVISWGSTGGSMTNNVTVIASGTSGKVTKVVGSGSLSNESNYYFNILVSDGAASEVQGILSTAQYILDFKAGGKGIAVGKVAELEDLFDVYWKTQFRQGIEVNPKLRIYNSQSNSCTIEAVGSNLIKVTYTGSDLEFDGGVVIGDMYFLNNSLSGIDQIEWNSNGLGGRVMKQIWSGTASTGSSITVSDLPYYNIIALGVSGTNTTIIAIRDLDNTNAIRGASLFPYLSSSDSNQAQGLYSVDLNANGTTLTLTRVWQNAMYYNGSTVTTYSGNNKGITINRIYGIL